MSIFRLFSLSMLSTFSIVAFGQVNSEFYNAAKNMINTTTKRILKRFVTLPITLTNQILAPILSHLRYWIIRTCRHSL